MSDLRALLDTTTPEPATLPDFDLDDIARRGTRRRLGKRLGAATLALAVLGGGLTAVLDANEPPELPIIDRAPGDDRRVGDWESLPSAPALTPRSEPIVRVTSRGDVVVAGGVQQDVTAATTDGQRLRGTAEFTDGALLDLGTGDWTPLPAGPAGADAEWGLGDDHLYLQTFGAADAVTADGAALVAGTGTATAWSVHRLDLRDPAGGWQAVPAPPGAEQDGRTFVARVLDDTVVAHALDRGEVDSLTFHVLRDGRWTTASGPAPTAAGRFTLTGDRDRLAVVSGDGSGSLTAAAVLDLATARWEPTDPSPFDHAATTTVLAAVRDGRALFVGPEPARSLGAAWLDLATGTWTPAQLPDLGPDAVGLVDHGEGSTVGRPWSLEVPRSLELLARDAGTRTTSDGATTSVASSTSSDDGVLSIHRLADDGSWQLAVDDLPQLRRRLGVGDLLWRPELLVLDDVTVGLRDPGLRTEGPDGQQLRRTAVLLRLDSDWALAPLPTVASGTTVAAAHGALFALGGRPIVFADDWDPSAPTPPPSFEVDDTTGLRYEVPADPLVTQGWDFADVGFPAAGTR